MLLAAQAKGVIFDVDETLLDTNVLDPLNGLHERARRQAVQEVGRRHDLPQLVVITPEEAVTDFLNAPVHSLEGAVWRRLFLAGLVTSEEAIDYTNPLLQEIATRKNELLTVLLRQEGKPLEGAVEFVEWLASLNLQDHMAIASTASRCDIDIFLEEITNLKRFFPNARIITKETVTHHKPHPEAFDKAFLSLSLPESARSQVLAFEDNPRGIMSAKAAGLFTCGITTIFSHEHLAGLAVPPDLIAGSFAEFTQLLKG